MGLLDEMLRDVQRFNEEICHLDISDGPVTLQPDRLKERSRHLGEEMDELIAAKNWEDQADALVDLIYVALGALVEIGVTPGTVFNEVHRANMEKVPGRNAKRPDNEYDAVKPEGWRPPDLMHASAAIPPDVLRMLSPVLLEVTLLRVKRGGEYNRGGIVIPDYFPLGEVSYYQMCHVKLLRCKSLMGGGDISDSLLDLINYATYWAEAHKRGDI